MKVYNQTNAILQHKKKFNNEQILQLQKVTVSVRKLWMPL